MDAQAESSEAAGRPNTRRHATFDLADSPSRVPSEGGTDNEEPYEGETKIHLSESQDDQKGDIKRSSTYPFSSPAGRGATIEHVTFESLRPQDGHEWSKLRAQLKPEIVPFRPPVERTKSKSSTFSRSPFNKGSANSSRKFGGTTLRSHSKSRPMQSNDDSSTEDTDSDILSADEDSASDVMASSSLAFDFSSIAPRRETQDKADTVPKAPVPKSSTKKKSEMYNETVYKILISHYISSTSRRSDSTAELLVDQPIETQDKQSDYLMRWMYVLSTTKLQSKLLTASYQPSPE